MENETVTISRSTYDNLIHIKNVSEGKIVRKRVRSTFGCQTWADYEFIGQEELTSGLTGEIDQLKEKLYKSKEQK